MEACKTVAEKRRGKQLAYISGAVALRCEACCPHKLIPADWIAWETENHHASGSRPSSGDGDLKQSATG